MEVIYDEKVCKVYDVKIENFYWGYYDGESVRRPGATWFLIGIEDCFIWVRKDECQPA